MSGYVLTVEEEEEREDDPTQVQSLLRAPCTSKTDEERVRRNARARQSAVDAVAAGRRSSLGLVGGPRGDEGWTVGGRCIFDF